MKKTYFASDFHLGIDARLTSLEREKLICRWLDAVRHDAEAIYLVGDVFDHWFEYKTVIPKGFSRILGKLAELRDANIPIYFFTGNHDMWMFSYLETEMDIPIYRQPIVREIHGKKFFIGHGDGLGPGDYGYKFIKKVFANPVCQWFFARLHPNFGLGAMHFFSGKSRAAQDPSVETSFLGAEKEWLILYSNKKLDEIAADFFIFGHRHLPIDWVLKNEKSRYINLGEWLTQATYVSYDGVTLAHHTFDTTDTTIYKNY